jgi:hypothetical protein
MLAKGMSTSAFSAASSATSSLEGTGSSPEVVYPSTPKTTAAMLRSR